MKRFDSQETLGAMIYPPQDKKNGKTGFVYSAEFQAMLDGLDDEDGAEESCGHGAEKKKRLSLEQVRALERIFEVNNRLEPERKVRVAEELGLQPRQVAIWFQNRRARWKTKLLEKDYGALKAEYDALRLSYDKLEKEKEGLVAELKELKAKLGEENTDSDRSDRKNIQLPDPDNNDTEQSKASLRAIWGDPTPTNPDYEVRNNGNLLEIDGYSGFRYGLSDSNCSGVFNEDRVLNSQLRYEGFSTYAPWMNCFSFSDSRAGLGYPAKGYYYPQFVKTEEQSLFGTGDSSSIFSVDQAPTLHWQY